jgi:hypothetical protein
MSIRIRLLIQDKHYGVFLGTHDLKNQTNCAFFRRTAAVAVQTPLVFLFCFTSKNVFVQRFAQKKESEVFTLPSCTITHNFPSF